MAGSGGSYNQGISDGVYVVISFSNWQLAIGHQHSALGIQLGQAIAGKLEDVNGLSAEC